MRSLIRKIFSVNYNFCFGFWKCIFKTVKVNFWKYNKPISNVCVFIAEFKKFFNKKEIHDSLFGFLQYVGPLTKRYR